MTKQNYFPLDYLLSIKRPEQVIDFLKVKIEEGFQWHNFGGVPDNFRQLAISKSGVKAMIERITNAIDALIENEKETRNNSKDKIIKSPREAIQEWFGVKGGHISFFNEKERREIAQKAIKIFIEDSGIEKKPTVIVKDYGIGVHPEEFLKSIIGLGGSLKVGKPYVLGAYGWGGSQTFIWCNGAYESANVESLPLAIIISRKNPALLQKEQKDEVGWTIIRYKDNPDQKIGVFQYLVNSEGKVPTASTENLPADFVYGTQITHLAYNLEQFYGRMTLSSYRMFQNFLFDPILPFWLYDSRHKEGRTISGNLSRLNTDEKGFIEYSNTQEFELNIGKIKVRYWVLKSKKEGYHLDSYLSKQNSTDTIAITLNGQQYDSLSKHIIKDAGFAFLSDYILFQIECDSLSSAMKKNIFPSTREDVRDTYKEIFKNEIISILQADEELKKLEEARKRDHLLTGDEDELKSVRKLLDKLITVNKKIIQGGGVGGGTKRKKKFKPKDPPTKLLILPEHRDINIIPGEEKKICIETDAPNNYLVRDKHIGNIECEIDNKDIKYKIRRGLLIDGNLNFYLEVDKDIPIGKKGNFNCILKDDRGVKIVATKKIETVSSPPPLPSNYPPTKFDILNEEDPLNIKKGRKSLIQIQCDGPDGLLERPEEKAILSVSFIPDVNVKVTGKSDLVRQRIRIFLQCLDNAKIGDRSEVICKLTLSNGSTLISKRQCIITPPPKETGEGGRSEVEIPNYEIIPVTPDDKNWVEFKWDEDAVGTYKKSGDSLVLYVSLGNKKYLNTLEAKSLTAEKLNNFKRKYLSYLGYHLWLMYENKTNEDQIMKNELDRTCQTILLALTQEI